MICTLVLARVMSRKMHCIQAIGQLSVLVAEGKGGSHLRLLKNIPILTELSDQEKQLLASKLALVTFAQGINEY